MWTDRHYKQIVTYRIFSTRLKQHASRKYNLQRPVSHTTKLVVLFSIRLYCMQVHVNHEPFQTISLTSTYGSGVNSEYSRKCISIFLNNCLIILSIILSRDEVEMSEFVFIVGRPIS